MAPSVQLGPLKSPNGTLYANDFGKANAFNQFFHVFIADDGYAPDFNKRTNANIDCSVFTLPEVKAAILNSKNSSFCGPDGCSL